MKKNINDIVIYAISAFAMLLVVLSFFIPEASWGIPVLILAALFYLLLKSEHFSNHSKDSKRNKTYVYLVGLSIICVGAVNIVKGFDLIGDMTYSPTLLIVTFVLFVFGVLSPKIPFNRTLGLRLPWTINHEPTWRYAHRMVGYCTFPTMPILIIGVSMNSDIVYGIGVLLWVLIPSFASFIYYRNWMKGKIVD